jgi:hypothetical protein
LLLEEFKAEQPTINLPSGTKGKAAKETALKALAAASNALNYDMEVFILNGLARTESPAEIGFVKASVYYSHSLITSSFKQIASMPGVSEKQLDETRNHVDKQAKRLKALGEDSEKARWKLDFSSLVDADVVPSASPYQLLFEAVLSQARARLLAMDDQDLLRMVFAPDLSG